LGKKPEKEGNDGRPKKKKNVSGRGRKGHSEKRGKKKAKGRSAREIGQRGSHRLGTEKTGSGQPD